MSDVRRVEPVPEGKMGTTTRVIAVIFVTACTIFWIFAFSPWARDIFQAPDQIEDEATVAALVTHCADAGVLLDDLAPASQIETPGDRAVVLVEANGILGAMRDDLATVPTSNDEDARLLRLWLADWDIYLADRDEHVNRLNTEGDVRFFNTVDNGVFIHERMDGFARVNDLGPCETPGDV